MLWEPPDLSSLVQATNHLPLATISSRGGFDRAAKGTELGAIRAGFVKRADLVGLQFSYFLGSGPDNGAAGGVSLHHQLVCTLGGIAKRLPQHFNHEFVGVKIVVFENNVVRRKSARARLIAGFGDRRRTGAAGHTVPLF